MGVSKTSDYIQKNIRMPNPSQEPPASSKAPNQDLKDMDILYTKSETYSFPLSQHQGLDDMGVLCTFKINLNSQNFDNGCI